MYKREFGRLKSIEALTYFSSSAKILDILKTLIFNRK